MIIASQSLLSDFLLPRAERHGNYFGHFIGMGHTQEYKDLLARFAQLANDPLHQTLLFKAALPTPNDQGLLAHFQAQAPHLDLGNLTRSPLELSRFDSLNLSIARALDMIVPHALTTEHFVTEDQQNLFIAKLLLLIDTYVANVDFSKPEVPKAIFYGPIKRQECYFILLLAAIGFDTFYLNPTHDVTFAMIDTLGMSQTLVLGDPAPFEDFDDLAASGVVIDHITTAARHASDELDAFMYTDSGLFRPWQFTKGTTRPILLDAIWEDIKTYWDEPARLRPGFKTSGQVVYPPVFFTKISGVPMNLNEYFEGVHRLCKTKRHRFYTQPNFANTFKLSSRDIYSLTYCLNPDKTINREAIKTHPLYKNMLTFRPEVQDFTLDKLDELLSKDASQLFNFKVTDQERTQLMALTFTLENTLLNLIDSYDFPYDIPKLILYINNRATFTTQSSMLLALFHTMGFDILLLCPNGANNIEMMLSSQYINTLRLPELAYDLELKNPEFEKPKSKSFFNKFFK